jgi:hypothetical protein
MEAVYTSETLAPPSSPHGVTNQITIDILTTVRTSNLKLKHVRIVVSTHFCFKSRKFANKFVSAFSIYGVTIILSP